MTNELKLKISHLLAIIVSLAFPISATFSKLKVSKEVSKVEVFSIGFLIILFVVAVTLRKMLWKWVKEWIGAVTMPPVIMWTVFMCIVVGLQSLADTLTKYLPTMQTICIAGLIGAGLGCIIDLISNLIWKPKPAELG